MHRRAAIDFTKRWLRRSAWAALTVWVLLFAGSFVTTLTVGRVVSFYWLHVNERGLVADRGTIVASWMTDWSDPRHVSVLFNRTVGAFALTPTPMSPAAMPRERSPSTRSSEFSQIPSAWFGSVVLPLDVPPVVSTSSWSNRVDVPGYRTIGIVVGVVPNSIAALAWAWVTVRRLRTLPWDVRLIGSTFVRAVRLVPLLALTVWVGVFALSYLAPFNAGLGYDYVAFRMDGSRMQAVHGVVELQWMTLYPTPETYPAKRSLACAALSPSDIEIAWMFSPSTQAERDAQQRRVWWGSAMWLVHSPAFTYEITSPATTTTRLTVGRFPSMAIVALWLVLVVRWSIQRRRRPAGRGFEVAVTGQPASPDAVAKNS